MDITVLLSGLLIGIIIDMIIQRISIRISSETNKRDRTNILVTLISGILFSISFFRFGLNIVFIKAVILSAILIVVSFIDYRYQIIPDMIVIIMLVTGILFSIVGDISVKNGILGMLTGGGILFLLALMPGAMGGGDIKLMFSVGYFLGPQKVLWALLLAFAFAALASLLLLGFRIKKAREYIPLGPFLAAGSLIVILLF